MNILLINFGGIGDEVLFLPTIRTIKEEYPNSKITLALEPRSATIKDLTDDIDEVIKCDIKASGIKKYLNILKFIYEAKKRKFDILISSGASPFIALIAYLTGAKTRVGYKTKTSFLLSHAVTLNKNQYAGKMYHDLVKPLTNKEYKNPQITLKTSFDLPTDGEFIAIHPGVSKMSVIKNIIKCPEVDFWEKLITEILNKGHKILLLGGPDDKDIIEKLQNIKHENLYNMFGKTKNLQDMASIINSSSAFICVDSAPLHISVALNKKTIAIFGPTNDKKLVPELDNIKIVRGKPCNICPCLWDVRQTTCEKLDCLKIDPLEICKFL